MVWRKDGIVTLYPCHSHLPGFRRLTITCVQLANFPHRRVTAKRPLAFSLISQNAHVNKVFWQQFQIYALPSLWVIKVAKGQRAKMTYTCTMIHIYRESRLNRPGSVSLASFANNIASNLGLVLSVFFCHYFSIFDGHFSIFYGHFSIFYGNTISS